jgi:hypothetical protein
VDGRYTVLVYGAAVEFVWRVDSGKMWMGGILYWFKALL